MINYTDEFLRVVKSTSPNGLITSLDVESLFTNNPLAETTHIIIESWYNHSRIREKVLILCTSKAPFHHINSKLGSTFVNFFIGYLENKVLSDFNIKPTRYLDDIFVIVKNERKLLEVKKNFEDKSILKFTCEISKNNNIQFLNFNVQILINKFVTLVYIKTTNDGNSINYHSECPCRYKIISTISLLNRALKVKSDWQIFNN